MSMPEIETGIRIPENPRTKWVRLLAQMRIGDSVWLPTKIDAQCLYWAAARSGWQCTRRQEGNGYRVWLLGER